MFAQLEQVLNLSSEHQLLSLELDKILHNQADASLFQHTYGWQANISFYEGLEKFVAWYRDHHSA